jgi:hypothetical protein
MPGAKPALALMRNLPAACDPNCLAPRLFLLILSALYYLQAIWKSWVKNPEPPVFPTVLPYAIPRRAFQSIYTHFYENQMI